MGAVLHQRRSAQRNFDVGHRRPIFAGVLSIIVFLVGAISLTQLPISEYPEVVPPTVVVRATYPGANPKTISETVAAPLRDSPRVATHHDQALYPSRLPGYPADEDWWMTGHTGATTRPEGALLIRGPDASGLAVLHAIRLSPLLPLPALMPGLITELRRRGCERLQVSTVAESDLAATLQRCGFLARAETVPLFALPLTPLGERCVHSVKDWEITNLDCDR